MPHRATRNPKLHSRRRDKRKSLWLALFMAYAGALSYGNVADCTELSAVPSPMQRSQNTQQTHNGKKDPARVLQEATIETKRVVPSGTASTWERYYSNGIHSLLERRFGHAEAMFLNAIRESKNTGAPRTSLVDSRLQLGRVYLKEERFPEALEIYRMTLPKAKDVYGDNSEQVAECYFGIARSQLLFDHKSARVNAQAALDILNRLKKNDGQLYGLTLHTMAISMARHGWQDDVRSLFNESRAILEKSPGFKEIDFADILREQALFYHSIGDRRNAQSLYEAGYKIKEKAVIANQPPSIAGEVKFKWEPGSTRAQEMIDSEFPFRYLSANGIRVAATVIDLWELIGVLVTVTNVSDRQAEFELGQPVLQKVDNTNFKLNRQVIPAVPPYSIDYVQKELSMWALTHTRPWLANIQKTRNVRGLVPPDGHDLFRGPNVFGIYGNWKAVSHTVPKNIGLMPSREGLESTNQESIDLPGLVERENVKIKGLTPVWLEPFESRTGELFYLNHRDIDVVIQVPVGNAIFELPFHTSLKYTH